MMLRKAVIIVVVFILGTAVICNNVSAVRPAAIPFTIFIGQNGLPSGSGIPSDFSLNCYGHSYLSVYYWNTVFLNTTVDNPVPLNQVLDLQVHCQPSGTCTAQADYRGDPERSEWCVLNMSSKVPFANISKENLWINCSGTGIEWDYLRCMREAEFTYPCENYYGSRNLHCLDLRNEDFSKCKAWNSAMRNQSRLPDNGCEIRLSLKPDDNAIPGHPVSSGITSRSLGPGSKDPFASLWCSILQVFGGRCE